MNSSAEDNQTRQTLSVASELRLAARRNRKLEAEADFFREGLLSWNDCCYLTTLNRSTLSDMVDMEKFPAPFKITPRRAVFVKKEVLHWIDMRSNEPRK